MRDLVKKIEKLKKTEVGRLISCRIEEFEKFLREKNKDKIFSELCFCLLTANWQAEKAIKLQRELNIDFLKASQKKLAKKLKSGGHRFWPQRAKSIVLARKNKEEISNLISSGKNSRPIRFWLVKNVHGLGMKESSHFLRNIGFKDLAIIDFHILDLLVANNLIERPRSLSVKNYLNIEDKLNNMGRTVSLSLAELDLYLWFIETGKILK